VSKRDEKNNEPHLPRRAVALRYNRNKEDAPRLVAKGSGYLAERIIEIAQAHGVTIYEDKELIELLAKLELYQVIPVELYQVIAEILAFVYRINKKAAGLQPLT
jgi:flagellar biosynthesis protein